MSSKMKGSIVAYDYEDFKDTIKRNRKRGDQWRFVQNHYALTNFNVDEILVVTKKFRLRTDSEAVLLGMEIDRIVREKQQIKAYDDQRKTSDMFRASRYA